MSVRIWKAKMRRETRAHLFLFYDVMPIAGRRVTSVPLCRGTVVESVRSRLLTKRAICCLRLLMENPARPGESHHPTHQSAHLPPIHPSFSLQRAWKEPFRLISTCLLYSFRQVGVKGTSVRNPRLWRDRTQGRKCTTLNQSQRRF